MRPDNNKKQQNNKSYGKRSTNDKRYSSVKPASNRFGDRKGSQSNRFGNDRSSSQSTPNRFGASKTPGRNFRFGATTKPQPEPVKLQSIDIRHIWEKMRQKSVPISEKQAMIEQMIPYFRGHIVDYSRRPTDARIMCTILRWGTQTHRGIIIGELQGHLFDLMQDYYSRRIIEKIASYPVIGHHSSGSASATAIDSAKTKELVTTANIAINELLQKISFLVLNANACKSLTTIWGTVPSEVREKIIFRLFNLNYEDCVAANCPTIEAYVRANPATYIPIIRIGMKLLGRAVNKTLIGSPILIAVANIIIPLLFSPIDGSITPENSNWLSDFCLSVCEDCLLLLIDKAEGCRLACYCIGLGTAKARAGAMSQKQIGGKFVTLACDPIAYLAIIKLILSTDDTVKLGSAFGLSYNTVASLLSCRAGIRVLHALIPHVDNKYLEFKTITEGEDSLSLERETFEQAVESFKQGMLGTELPQWAIRTLYETSWEYFLSKAKNSAAVIRTNASRTIRLTDEEKEAEKNKTAEQKAIEKAALEKSYDEMAPKKLLFKAFPEITKKPATRKAIELSQYVTKAYVAAFSDPLVLAKAIADNNETPRLIEDFLKMLSNKDLKVPLEQDQYNQIVKALADAALIMTDGTNVVVTEKDSFRNYTDLLRNANATTNENEDSNNENEAAEENDDEQQRRRKNLEVSIDEADQYAEDDEVDNEEEFEEFEEEDDEDNNENENVNSEAKAPENRNSRYNNNESAKNRKKQSDPEPLFRHYIGYFTYRKLLKSVSKLPEMLLSKFETEKENVGKYLISKRGAFILSHIIENNPSLKNDICKIVDINELDQNDQGVSLLLKLL